jgi:hypothetical protein
MTVGLREISIRKPIACLSLSSMTKRKEAGSLREDDRPRVEIQAREFYVRAFFEMHRLVVALHRFSER